MSAKKSETVTIKLPLDLVTWAKGRSRVRREGLQKLITRLMRREKDGGAALDIDVFEREDGLVQIDLFPDEPQHTIVAKTREEAFAELQMSIDNNRADWNRWRRNRATLPGFTKVEFKRIEVEVGCLRLVAP